MSRVHSDSSCEERLVYQKLLYRHKKLKEARDFFYARGYLELDPPFLSKYAVPTPYIEPIKTVCGRYLHTSPEIAIKKILSKIQQNCFFLGHVFRQEEISPLHTEEFTMIEYYKIDTDRNAFLKEVLDLLSLFIPIDTIQTFSYQQAFDRFVPDNYQHDKEILHLSNTDKRHWAWSIYVEKNLQDLTIIQDFLPEDACLAKLNNKGFANRFEIYYRGIELANAFEELTDSKEQKNRFIQDQQQRLKNGQQELSVDQEFLACVEDIPKNTFGIALGFDRLVNNFSTTDKI